VVPSPLGVAPPVTDPTQDADDGTTGSPNDGVDFSKLSEEELREQLKATTTALTRANKQAERARLKAAAPKPAPPKATPVVDGTPEVTQAILDGIKSDTAAEYEGKYKPLIIRNAAAAALSAAGVSLPQDKDKRSALVKRLTGMMDMEQVSVDDKGELDGLDEEIDLLKELVPELFKIKKPAPAKIDGVDKGQGRAKPLDPTEQLAALVFGTGQ
jgi:hypothetical protein